MRRSHWLLAAFLFIGLGCQTIAEPAVNARMTTEVPDGIATPDRLETRIGTLHLSDGVPDRESAQKVYDNLDFQRGVQAYLTSLQIASMSGMRAGLLDFGPANTTVVSFENLMDSKALWLTPNTVSVYNATWLEVKDEPMIIETPPNVLGFIDDAFFNYVVDFGNAGPDRGQGGTFYIVPPGYEGRVNAPQDAHVVRTRTYGHWVIWRGFLVDGSPASAVATTRERFRIYPASQKKDPPRMTFVNASGKFHSTIHRMDYGIYEEINGVIQSEPASAGDPEILGLLASIGIQKGQEFEPDARMEKILREAADVGAATVRTLAARPRGDSWYFYPGDSQWNTPFVGGSHEFLANGARLLDARAYFFFYATGITPAMTMKMVGKGSQYAVAYLDSKGDALDGGATYRINLPPNVPAKDFWSFTLYDNQTRAMLQTDQQFPGIDSNKEGLEKNSDGSYDIYFGPSAPAGKEANWLQTIPGKGWNTILRLYGPLEPWFGKTWRPGDVEGME